MHHTWDEAAERWHLEGLGRARETIRREAQLLRWLWPKIHDKTLDQLRRAVILDLRREALAEGWSNRSANYVAQLVTTVMRAAVDWEWTTAPPPRIKPLKLPPSRARWLTPEQARALLAALPPTVSDMALLALETGLRRANVTGLLWAWVDVRTWTIFVPAAVMKAREPLAVPVESPDARAMLLRWRERRAEGCAHVFHNGGRPVLQPNGKAWLRTLERIGIEDFRWHDLRHTWASWHAQAGTDQRVLQDMGAWKTPGMVTRYSHLNTHQAREAAGAMVLWREPAEARVRGPASALMCVESAAPAG